MQLLRELRSRESEPATARSLLVSGVFTKGLLPCRLGLQKSVQLQ